ncbi:hypothetical protein V1512DRAFT_245826 [Lipomyces arxii]|uniref:uncharacterized protein n=1 Tax=Lipomyces arxii TaxID=56418 RepID=UPI0034CDB77C
MPANTVVSVYQSALHLDPTRYEDAFSFKPERYLNHTLKADAYAANSFITIAKIIRAFAILPPLNEDGTLGKVDISEKAYDVGADSLLNHSKLRHVLRSWVVEGTIRKEWCDAARDGYMLGVGPRRDQDEYYNYGYGSDRHHHHHYGLGYGTSEDLEHAANAAAYAAASAVKDLEEGHTGYYGHDHSAVSLNPQFVEGYRAGRRHDRI